MKLATTQTMARYLAKNTKHGGYEIKQEKLPVDAFRLRVSYDVWANDGDFDFSTNKFSVIKIVYPQEYFAEPKYLTTNDLCRIYKNAKERTAAGFVEAFDDFIEV